jgi:hypothetical protein
VRRLVHLASVWTLFHFVGSQPKHVDWELIMGKLSPPLKMQAWLNSALSFHRVLKNPRSQLAFLPRNIAHVGNEQFLDEARRIKVVNGDNNSVGLTRRKFLFANAMAAGLATLPMASWAVETELEPQEQTNQNGEQNMNTIVTKDGVQIFSRTGAPASPSSSATAGR